MSEPSIHDWARTCLVTDERGWIFCLVDGKVATVIEERAVRDAWFETWKDQVDDRPPDPIGAQKMSAQVSAIARENPHGLSPKMLADYQRHAAAVSRNARAELVRWHGGTGKELRLIESVGLTFASAIAPKEDE